MSEPCLLLLSADIAGATEFKQTHQGHGDTPNWLQPFAAFFKEVPLVLMGKLAAAFAEEDSIPAVGLWRVAGDEVIFLARPSGVREAALLTEAFVAMVDDYDNRLHAREGLHLRGGAWLAPIGTENIEIEIPEMASAGAGSAPYRDFLGPDVDSGFRLLKFAPRGSTILSLKLAAALAAGGLATSLDVGLIRNESLRGLYGGRPYPMLIAGLGHLGDAALLEIERDFAKEGPGFRPFRFADTTSTAGHVPGQIPGQMP